MAKQQQHTKYGGRWVLNEDGQQMIFVVEPEHPPIPDQVIPLPDPPSDCDNSALMMSDGSLTMSCFDPDPDMDTDTTDTDTDTDMDHIVPNHTPIYYDYMNEYTDVGDENHAGHHDIYTNKNNNYDHHHQHDMMIERSGGVNNNNGDEGDDDDDDTENNDTDETTTISSTMDDSHCHDNRTSKSNIDNDAAMLTPDLEEGQQQQQQQHQNNNMTVMMEQQQHQRQHQSIFVSKTKNNKDDNDSNEKNSSLNNNKNNKNNGSKKRVTLFVEPEKEAKDKIKNEKKKKLMTKQQHKKEKKKNNSNSNSTSCYHTLMYCVFGVSLLAIVIGGGVSAMIYFGIININVNASPTTTIDNSSSNNNSDTTSNSNSSSDSDSDSNTPIVSDKDTTTTTNNNNNNSSISTNVAPISELVATNTPTGVDSSSSSSVEYWMIVDILRDEFHLVVPTKNEDNDNDNDNDNEEPTPMNQAIDWFVEELQLFPTYMDHYHDLAKFAQRFALVTMQFALQHDGDGEGGGRRPNDNDEDVDVDPSTEPQQQQQQTVIVNNYFPFQQTQGDDECHWEGIQCDSEGNRRVIAVDFSDSELRGTIPTEIRFLYHLQHLDLSTNHIQGSIPEELFDLRHLQRLYLYHNDLTGTISPYIGQLKSLQYLHLSHNSLTGTIPSQLGGASSGMINDDEFSSPLKYMNFYDNKITGTIPTNLRLHNLTYFDVGRNFIGGSIPDDIGEDFMELRYLHIDHNRFTEAIPDTIPPMANGRLLSFLANNNRLEGYVPDNWSRYNKLVQYTLQNNYFEELGPNNCNFSVFHQEGGSNNGELIEFKADCDICSCNDIFCDSMCAGR